LKYKHILIFILSESSDSKKLKLNWNLNNGSIFYVYSLPVNKTIYFLHFSEFLLLLNLIEELKIIWNIKIHYFIWRQMIGRVTIFFKREFEFYFFIVIIWFMCREFCIRHIPYKKKYCIRKKLQKKSANTFQNLLFVPVIRSLLGHILFSVDNEIIFSKINKHEQVNRGSQFFLQL
jgi:hypothetical protein